MMYLTLHRKCEDCGGTGAAEYPVPPWNEHALRRCPACNGEGAIPKNVTLQEFAAMIETIRTGEIAVKEATR